MDIEAYKQALLPIIKKSYQGIIPEKGISKTMKHLEGQYDMMLKNLPTDKKHRKVYMQRFKSEFILGLNMLHGIQNKSFSLQFNKTSKAEIHSILEATVEQHLNLCYETIKEEDLPQKVFLNEKVWQLLNRHFGVIEKNPEIDNELINIWINFAKYAESPGAFFADFEKIRSKVAEEYGFKDEFKDDLEELFKDEFRIKGMDYPQIPLIAPPKYDEDIILPEETDPRAPDYIYPKGKVVRLDRFIKEQGPSLQSLETRIRTYKENKNHLIRPEIEKLKDLTKEWVAQEILANKGRFRKGFFSRKYKLDNKTIMKIRNHIRNYVDEKGGLLAYHKDSIIKKVTDQLTYQEFTKIDLKKRNINIFLLNGYETLMDQAKETAVQSKLYGSNAGLSNVFMDKKKIKEFEDYVKSSVSKNVLSLDQEIWDRVTDYVTIKKIKNINGTYQKLHRLGITLAAS